MWQLSELKNYVHEYDFLQDNACVHACGKSSKCANIQLVCTEDATKTDSLARPINAPATIIIIKKTEGNTKQGWNAETPQLPHLVIIKASRCNNAVATFTHTGLNAVSHAVCCKLDFELVLNFND